MLHARSVLLALALTPWFLAGCGGGGSGGASGPAELSGTVLFDESGSGFPGLMGGSNFDTALDLGRIAGAHRSQHAAGQGLSSLSALVERDSWVEVRASASGTLMVWDPVEGAIKAHAEGAEPRLRVRARGALQVAYDCEGAAARVWLSVLPADGTRTVRGIEAQGQPDPDVEGRFAAWLQPAHRIQAGELIVLPKVGVSADALATAHGCERALSIPGDASLLRFPVSLALEPDAQQRATWSKVRALAEDARVVYSELNTLHRPLGGSVTPNDSFYNLQWHYPLIHLPEAWGITQGSVNTIVAVIDTGETQHPDLDSRQIAGFDFISSPAIGGDGNGIDADPTDVGDGVGLQPSSFHGTHVAGTIGAETGNGQGVAGVTWATRIMHLRTLGLGGGTDFDIANAVRYAARLSNSSGTLPAERAHVINMSLGGGASNATFQNAVTAARNAGVVIFAASGNENTSAPSFPASYSGVISVAAVDLNAQRAPYSNFGPTVDLAAPGGNTAVNLNGDNFVDGVLSTMFDDTVTPAEAVFAFSQGTSMACPHAAGVAALMLAVNPALTPAQIETILTSTATDIGAPGRDDLFGHGLIHAYHAVLEAQGGTGPSTPVLSLSPTTMAFGTQLTQLTAQVSNAGTGQLLVSEVNTTFSGAQPWLSAVAVPSGGSSSNASGVTVTVNRTGLADGDYTGTVNVLSNGGNLSISVSMSVVATAPLVDVDLYVLLVDASTFDTVAGALVNPSLGLDYLLEDLPAGDYYLVCGSDDDGDLFIFGDNDLYSGVYPSINYPEVISMDEGDSLSGMDFPVTGGAAPTPTLQGGFGALRILRSMGPDAR
jgi:serine protease